MAVYDLVFAQIGRETSGTYGTSVVATSKLMNFTGGTLTIGEKSQIVPEKGRIAPSQNVAQLYQDAQAKMDFICSYDDLPFFWQALMGFASPSTAAVPYVWPYTGPQLSVPVAPAIYSIEFGATGASYKATSAVLQKINLKITKMDYWKISTDWVAQVAATVGMATVADRTTIPIRAADNNIYMDPASGTMGTTLLTGSLMDADITIDTKRHIKPFVGSLNPQNWGEAQWSVTAKVGLEYNATGKAVVDALFSGLVQRQFRFKSSGTSASGGTGLIAQVDLPLAITKPVSLFRNENGNIAVNLDMEGYYSTGFGAWLKTSASLYSTGGAGYIV